MVKLLAFAVAAGMLIAGCSAQYSYGQATYYNSIDHGYCGFGRNIPSNGFVAAWPFIETGPNGQGYPQPGAAGQGCGSCFEVSCVPQWVESADGSIYLDRRDACADPNRAVVVRVVDECRCSLPRDSNLPKGNFNWCCNTPTPRLRVNRHIDLSQQAFTALVRGGDYGLGIIGIRWRPTSCSRIGVVSAGSSSTTPAPTPVQALTSSNPPRPTNPSTPSSGPTTTGSTTGTSSTNTNNRPSSGNSRPSRGSKKSSTKSSTSTPPQGLQKEPARQNTQELPLIAQCGGTGGACRKHGPGNVCKDKPFFGYSCARGLNCERQNQYYWQCVRPNKNNIDDGTYPIGSAVKSTQDLLSTAAAAAAAAVTAPTVKVLKELQQCGGKGAACEDFGGCVDKAWDGYVCDQGLTCARQNEWYRQCIKTTTGNSPATTPANTNTNANTPTTPTPTPTPTPASPSSTPPPPQSPAKVQAAGQQCGGVAGDCNNLGGCVDGPSAGVKCAAGLTCVRQNNFYWECKA